MKKLLITFLALIFAITAYAQKDVTQFLGIPVDGSKTEMIRKLKKKGFRPISPSSDVLHGEFNGAKVEIHVITYNDKVCRIMICDENFTNEAGIINRFNTLCRQFQNNPRYMPSLEDYKIPSEEDISFNMSIKNKRYEALFYQSPIRPDVSDAQISEESEADLQSSVDKLFSLSDEEREEIISQATEKVFKELYSKPVWFMISEHYGKYYICMYYDNEYNRPNGQDL